MGRYIDLRTDFGFKRLFGSEESKEILQQFLFDILDLPYPIVELSYIPQEQLPASPQERRGIYDVYCVDSMGRRFIVEMQREALNNIKERALYYSTFAITYQAQRGLDWQFSLLPIYCVIVMDFDMDRDEQFLRRVQLMDTAQKTLFYDKLTFVYIELSKFKAPDREMTPAEKWIYLLRYMPELQDIPAELANEPFTQAFAIAEETALSAEERWFYEGSLKQARTFYAELASARNEGLQQGLEEGLEQGEQKKAREIAKAMLQQALDLSLIMQITGLSAKEINEL